MDARDLVLNKEISEYWKANHMMEDSFEQLFLTVRAYDTLENKIKYLQELDCKDQIGLDDFTPYSVDKIVKYYQDILEELYSTNDSERIKVFTISKLDFNDTINLADTFNPGFFSLTDVYFSLDEVIEDYGEDKDLSILCTVYNLKDHKKDKEYEILMINGKISSVYQFIEDKKRFESSDLNVFIQYMFSYFFGFHYTNNKRLPFYPFKNGTKVKVYNNVLSKPLVKYIHTEVDGNRTSYIYLGDSNDTYEAIRDPNTLFITANIFQLYYNFYDWMKEVKD